MMENYALLLDCHRSGQIPEAAWQEHLADAGFAAFVQEQNDHDHSSLMQPRKKLTDA